MTNEQITSLLKDCQALWFKWRDVPLTVHKSGPKWDQVLEEANGIIEQHGNTSHVFDLVHFFTDELHLRAEEREGK